MSLIVPGNNRDAANNIVAAALENPSGFISTVRNIARSAIRAHPQRKRRQMTSKKKNGKSKSRSGASNGSRSKSMLSNRVVSVYRKKRKSKRQKRRPVMSKRLRRAIMRLHGQIEGKLYTYRVCSKKQITCSSNQCSYTGTVFGTQTVMDTVASAYGKQLSGAGAIETIDYNDSDAHSLKLKGKLSVKAFFRNNASQGCIADVYWVQPKDDGDNGAVALITSGLDDMALGDGGLETDPCFYPSDSKLFKQQYKILKHTRYSLEPGASVTDYCRRQVFWDQDLENLRSETYQKASTLEVLVRLQGTVCHSAATASEIGLSQGQLDAVYFEKIDVRGIGSFNQLDHAAGSSSLSTMTGPTQFQSSDPGEETFTT